MKALFVFSLLLCSLKTVGHSTEWDTQLTALSLTPLYFVKGSWDRQSRNSYFQSNRAAEFFVFSLESPQDIAIKIPNKDPSQPRLVLTIFQIHAYDDNSIIYSDLTPVQGHYDQSGRWMSRSRERYEDGEPHIIELSLEAGAYGIEARPARERWGQFQYNILAIDERIPLLERRINWQPYPLPYPNPKGIPGSIPLPGLSP